jgi:antitoxin ParD1/3/4
LERLTITVPAEMTTAVKQAVHDGAYASTSEVVREALREWNIRRQLKLDELTALKADIDQGLADVAAGRVKAFNENNIIERGRKLLADRSS